jgi:hypothetical protein
MSARERPKFTGVRTYLDPQGRFTMRFPTDWHRFELENNLDGFLYSPQAENPQTWVSVWLSHLDDVVVAEDLDELRAGADEGLSQLSDYQALTSNNDALGNLVRLERIYTFREGDVVRKRKVWMLYVAQWSYVITYQGENEEEYHHWFAMANYCFNAFNLPEALWFAADRDLNPHGIAS